MLPLIRRAAQNQARLHPDAASGKIKARIRECLTEVESFCIRMKHINRRIVCHDLFHVKESIEKELIKLIVGHVVVFDLAGGPFIIHVVRRVRDDKVCFLALHQHVVGFFLRGITTNKPVPSQGPNVPHLRNGRFFQFTIDIKVIILDIGIIFKKVRELFLIKASEGEVECLCLQRFNLDT